MELREILLPLRKWWWLILAAALVGGVSGLLATRRQPPIYATHTTVMVGNVIDNPNPKAYDLMLNQQLANTYADMARLDNLRETTMATLGLSWLPQYTVNVMPNTQLLRITVTDSDPQRAQAVANELVTQLAKLTPAGSGRQTQERQAFVEQQLSQLEVRIAETQEEITVKQDLLAGMFSARQIADTQAQVTALQNKLTTLQANYGTFLLSTPQGSVNTINVVEPAALPTTPVGPNKLATILLAVALGVILGTAAAYLIEYLDDTFENPDDVQRGLGVITLGAVPRIEGNGAEPVGLTGGQTAAAEAYRVLRTNLQFAAVGRPLRTLLVTSPAPSEGKSLTVANLAVALAEVGRSVIAVDTDLRRPRLHKLFGVPNNAGVTTALLAEQPSLDGLLQAGPVPGLRILTSGPLPPNPAALLGSEPMHALLALLGKEADMLVLDSPPTVGLSDTPVLASQTDGVLLVLDVGMTRREVARRAVETLQHVKAPIVGALLNRVPTRGNRYYYYYYGYDYGADSQRNGGSPGEPGGNGRQKHREQRKEPASPAAG